MKEKLRKYIGDKAFYKMSLAIIIPVVIQQLILSLAGYVDSVMINSYSQEAYVGVSTANRFMFFMNFFYIGLAAGIAVFVSQFAGAKDKKSITGTIQLSVVLSLILGIISMFIISIGGPIVLKIFIRDSDPSSLAAISAGNEYLQVIAIGAIFLLLNFMISTIYRSLGKTKMPMYAGVIGIVVNMGLNFILIYGLFGAPELGAKGAAIATVISKVVEVGILIVVALLYDIDKYIKKVFTSFEINSYIVKQYFKKGTPILLNEILWAFGVVAMAALITDGNSEWLTSFNYAQNVTDLFFVYFSGIAAGTAILVGNTLGENDFVKAKDYANKLIGMTVIASLIAIVLLVTVAPLLLLTLLPVNHIYWDAFGIIVITATFIVLYGLNGVIYFILRAGGDSLRAFFVDQLPTYLVGIPLTFLLQKLEPQLQLGLILIFLSTRIVDIIKLVFSIKFYKKENWLQNLTIQKV